MTENLFLNEKIRIFYGDRPLKHWKGAIMTKPMSGKVTLVSGGPTIASELLQRHIQTLVNDNARWQTLIADDILWVLPYAPAIGHPARLSGQIGRASCRERV